MSTCTKHLILLIVFATVTAVKSQEELSCGGFSNCISYWDGCNICGCDNSSSITMCTDMACIDIDYGTPECRECTDNYILHNGTCILSICNLPQKPGPCEAYLHRYYYNNVTETCDSFYYGGCQGNDNNFETTESCLELSEQCQTITEPTTTQATTCGNVEHCNLYSNRCDTHCVCSDDGDIMCADVWFTSLTASFDGHCEPQDPECVGCNDGYYISNGECVEDRECEEGYTMIDGECEEDRECEEGYAMIDGECEEDTTHIIYVNDICELYSQSGPCDAALYRYFYDPLTGECLVFTYGGCDGNGNNFESERECFEECAPFIYDDTNAVMHIWVKSSVVFLIYWLLFNWM